MRMVRSGHIDYDAITASLQAGLTVRDVARAHQVSEPTVARVRALLASAGDMSAPKPRQSRVTTAEQARTLYKDGVSIEDIARQLGRAVSTVSAYLGRHRHRVTAARYTRIAALYAEGWSYTDIAHEVGTTPQIVSMELARGAEPAREGGRDE
jgi:DNA-binding NarL/FixJ family response regulator